MPHLASYQKTMKTLKAILKQIAPIKVPVTKLAKPVKKVVDGFTAVKLAKKKVRDGKL
jgi:hypothetical protein